MFDRKAAEFDLDTFVWQVCFSAANSLSMTIVDSFGEQTDTATGVVNLVRVRRRCQVFM